MLAGTLLVLTSLLIGFQIEFEQGHFIFLFFFQVSADQNRATHVVFAVKRLDGIVL